MTKVFIASRVGAKTKEQFEKNLTRMKAFARFALKKGFHPFPTALMYCAFMNDFDADERALGQKLGREDLLGCEEIWALEDGQAFSEGVRGDMLTAHKHGLAVKIWNTETVENFLIENDPHGHELWLKSK